MSGKEERNYCLLKKWLLDVLDLVRSSVSHSVAYRSFLFVRFMMFLFLFPPFIQRQSARAFGTTFRRPQISFIKHEAADGFCSAAAPGER